MSSAYKLWAKRFRWADKKDAPLYNFPNEPGDVNAYPTDPLYAERDWNTSLICVQTSARRLCKDFFNDFCAPIVIALEQLMLGKMTEQKATKLIQKSLDRRPELQKFLNHKWDSPGSSPHHHLVMMGYAAQVRDARIEEQHRLLILDWQRDYAFDPEILEWVDKRAGDDVECKR